MYINKEEIYTIFEPGEHVVFISRLESSNSRNIYPYAYGIGDNTINNFDINDGYEVFGFDDKYVYYRNILPVRINTTSKCDYARFGNPVLKRY